MKLMKKLLFVILTLALSLSLLTACDFESTGTNTTDTGNEGTDAPTDNGTPEEPSENPVTYPIAHNVDVPDGTQNALTIDYSVNENSTITVTVSVKGNVKFAGLTGSLNYDPSTITYVSSAAVQSDFVVNPDRAGEIAFTFAKIDNVVEASTLFNATFSYTGKVNTKLNIEIEEGSFADAQLQNVDYTILGGEIVID